METPYYLQPNESASQGEILFQIPIYSNPVPSGPNQSVGLLESIWNDLAQESADLVGDATDYVFDSAKNAWVSVKDAVRESVAETAGAFTGVFDWAKTQILWFVIGGLVIIWVVAKSGILGQAASLAGAIK